MKRALRKLLLYVSAAILLATPPLAAQAAGEWLGNLDAGAAKLRLGLHVEARSDGSLTAVLDSLDQGAKIPIDTVTFESGTLRFAIQSIGAAYEGALKAGGSAVEGVWSQSGRKLPLTFNRVEKPVVLNRPQNPRPPFPYQSIEVAFRSAAGDVRLAGTFVVPAGKGPFPAVALVTGSGPQDRDETLMGHKPFLVIADALARRGIASLRWDDRGAGESAGDNLGSTLDDFVADTRAAVAFLRARPEVDRNAVGIVGHSEGGLIAPLAAAADRSVAFLVLLAPPGEPIRSLLQHQARDLYRLQGVDPKLIDRVVAVGAEDFALAADPALPSGELRKKLRARVESRRNQFTAEERAALRVDPNVIEEMIQVETSAWFRSLIRQDPAVPLRAVKVPVLALFGEKDLQVEPRENAGLVRAALAAGNPDHEEKILPGLNHLFQHARTGAPGDYGTIEETFAPEALTAIGDWIGARWAKSRSTGR
jgi:uncharacterized protein